ncbi:hypothetical protein P8A21_39390 [Streptomyces poriferorum]|uniref:hypothetical protein n=1 Tax=Streptomyces poriferorum TaxID=2798799 RepID=UPI00273D7A8A|nr:hypothetical protein [Streptomyces sp. Alt1]WLQ45998.1 hypothetical protein P8A21_00040 [Streptomyces sp. Alt1]WLQ53184.1 hypothetical protein P8A21_39390 [Streptomyces sp. Alt1]
MLLSLLSAAALHHPDHIKRLLLTLTAALGAIIATLALGSAFAPTTATRTAARHTLDSCYAWCPGTHHATDPPRHLRRWLTNRRSSAALRPADARRPAAADHGLPPPTRQRVGVSGC